MSITLGSLDVGVNFVGDASSMQAATASAAAGMEKFGTTSSKALRQAKEEAMGTEQALSRLSTGLKGAVIGGSMAVALVKLKKSISETIEMLIQAQIQVDKWNNGFKFAAGSMAAGAAEMAFVREEANRLGLELGGAATQYMKFVAASRGSSMARAQTRELFTSIAEAATVMGMSVEQAERAMMAVVQMMSKGKVQAEELRGQLGEHLPGAFSIAARAMGVTEAELNKLLETGQVMSTDFLPKFGAQLRKELGGSVEDATKSMQASVNRYNTAWLSLQQSLAQAGASDFIAGQMNILSDVVGNISTRMDAARVAGGGFWAQIGAGAVGLAQFANPINAVSYSAQSLDARLKEARESLVELQKTAKTSPDSPFFRVEIAQTRMLIDELERAKQARDQLSQGPLPTGSVGSGDTVLSRAQADDYNKRLLARKKFLDDFATPSEKFTAELAKTKALLGDLFTPADEARLRDKYIKPIKEAKDQTDQFARVLESLQEKSSGLNTDYSENLSTLFKGFQAGRFGQGEGGVENYRRAVESLIQLQPFFKEGLKAEADAMEAARKAAAGYASDLDRVALADADVIQKANEYADQLDENIRATEYEASLLGQSNTQRQIALKQYAIEVGLQKQILAIKREMASEDEQAWAIASATAAANRAKASAATQVVNEEFQRTSDQIEQSLTDALMRGFESGKDFAQVLRDTVVNMFQTMVLRPVISAVVSPVAGAITNALGFPGGGGGGGGSGGVLGQVGNAFGIYNGLSAMGGLASSASIASGLTYGTAAFSQQSVMLAAQEAGFSAAAGASAGSTASSIAAAAPYLAALGAIALLSNATKGETRYGGQYGYSFDGTLQDYRRGGDFAGAVQGVNRITGAEVFAEKEVQGAIAGTVTSINTLLTNAGSSAALVGFQAGLETSGKGRGGVFVGGTLSTGGTFGESGIGGSPYDGNLFEKTSTQSPDAQTALANFALDLQQATIQALQAATDLPEALQDTIRDVDAEALTADTAAALLQSIDAQVTGVKQLRAAFDAMGLDALANSTYDFAAALAQASGGFDVLGQNLGAYYQNFYTQSERTANATVQLTEALSALGLEMPATLAEYRAMVDETLSGGNTTAAAELIKLSTAFYEIETAASAATSAILKQVEAESATLADYTRAKSRLLLGLDVPGFAAGGLHSGGLRIVGENGPELEATGPARYWNADQTAAIMAGQATQSNADLVAEMRALRAEVSNLRAETRATATHTAKTARLLDRAMPDGNSIQTTTAPA